MKIFKVADKFSTVKKADKRMSNKNENGVVAIQFDWVLFWDHCTYVAYVDLCNIERQNECACWSVEDKQRIRSCVERQLLSHQTAGRQFHWMTQITSLPGPDAVTMLISRRHGDVSPYCVRAFRAAAAAARLCLLRGDCAAINCSIC